MELYNWQKECIQIWQKHHYHGIVHVVTGAGKTFFALSAAHQLDTCLNGKLRIKIIVPTLPLVKGWTTSIHSYFSISTSDSGILGIFTGERKNSLDHKIMIYTIQSARYHLARHIYQDAMSGYPILLIADECHHYSSSENRKIFDFLKQADFPYDHYYSLGLSATPQAAEHYSDILVPALGDEIYHYSFTDGVRDQTVSDFCIYQIAVPFSPEELEEYDILSQKLSLLRIKLYQNYPFLRKIQYRRDYFLALKNLIETDGDDSPAAAFLSLSYQRQRLIGDAHARIDCTLDLISALHSTERILIFSEKIIQAELIYQLLHERYPNQVGLYHSEMHREIRRNTLEQFKLGIIRILVSCKALDEGIDVPDATVGIILSGTSVNRQRIQRLGRILRKNKDKPYACLYYLYIKESSEESSFLPNQLHSVRICNLSYHSSNHIFHHPEYENAATKLLHSFQQKNLTESHLNELYQCIMEGLLRNDWLLPASELQYKRDHTTDTHEKNYWHCMMNIAQSETYCTLD